MRRLLAAFALFASLSYGQSYDRLVAGAKLWNFVKYVHPRVTSSDVDWDGAFTRAVPKVLAATNDAEFSQALDELLGSLKDPATHIGWQGTGGRVSAVLEVRDGVTVVTFQPGGTGNAAELTNRLRGKGPVTFDLRGSLNAAFLIGSLPLRTDSIGPALALRLHSGYANDSGGYSGYHSSWEIQDRPTVTAAVIPSNAVTPVFLVNHETQIPYVALAAQASGAGAIVTEDSIGDQTVDLVTPLWERPAPIATIRVKELAYGDGTTGITPNLVLHKSGDEALAAAIEMAKNGKWPPPEPRRRLGLPPARFTEKDYTDTPYPTAEIRMLAAVRVWGVFHYFHPYRHLYGEDWDAVLAQFLPKVANAADARNYHLAIAEMVAHTHDTHCFVSSGELSKFYGLAAPPVEVRYIEGRPVVTRVIDETLASSIHPGDLLVKIDGEPYSKRAAELEKHISASTPQSLENRVMGLLLRGDAGPVQVTLKNAAGEERDIKLARTTAILRQFSPSRGGEVFHLVTPKIGYVDLERLTNAQVDTMFAAFKDTEGIIMDMRGYPQGTAWSIAPRLTEKEQIVDAVFRRNIVNVDLPEVGAIGSQLFEQRIPAYNGPRYKGKSVMLIDDRAISQSEHSGLMYKTAGGTVFIGSPTTGANGDTTYFFAPGGIRISFSGHDVRWPDGKQLQRVRRRVTLTQSGFSRLNRRVLRHAHG
jgi:C-terminal processing protease CtpA/Prc